MKVSIVSVSRSACHRTSGRWLMPGGMQFQRAFAGRLPLHVVRQQHGQLVFRHRAQPSFSQ